MKAVSLLLTFTHTQCRDSTQTHVLAKMAKIALIYEYIDIFTLRKATEYKTKHYYYYHSENKKKKKICFVFQLFELTNFILNIRYTIIYES